MPENTNLEDVGSSPAASSKQCDRMTVAELRSAVEYDPVVGLFRWLCARRQQAPSWFKGNRGHRRYRYLYIDGRRCLAHVAAWALMTGEWPSIEVDHRDRDPSNNVWSNLRMATHAQNTRNRSVGANNTTGIVGVSRFGKKFRASIKCDGKRAWLGVYETIEQAAAARMLMARRLDAEYFPQ